MVLVWVTLTDIRRRINDFESVHDRYGTSIRNVKEKILLEFGDKKKLCVANAWFETKRRIIKYSIVGNKIAIDFVLVGGSKKKYLTDVKAIFLKLQHRLMEQTKTKKVKESSDEQTN